MAFKKLVACFAINALLNGETDCTLSDIVEIIGQDRYKLGVIGQNLEISTCISGKKKLFLQMISTREIDCYQNWSGL